MFCYFIYLYCLLIGHRMFYKKVTWQSEPCNAKSSRECWHFSCQNTNQLYEIRQQLKVRRNNKGISVGVKGILLTDAQKGSFIAHRWWYSKNHRFKSAAVYTSLTLRIIPEMWKYKSLHSTHYLNICSGLFHLPTLIVLKV